MAIAGPDLNDLKAQRAELEAVLRSEHFTRAPTLANLLSYLCEKYFAGEANQIKEYSVGVEVFHRGPSFDQNADSIVRVEANRLRKRLAAYYAGEGASHRLRIAIPVGQYVPEFESGRSQQGKSQLASGALPGAGWRGIASAAGRLGERWIAQPDRRSWRLAAALALALLVLGIALLFIRQMRQVPQTAVSNQSPAQPAESQLGPPIGEEIRILAG